MKDLLSWIKETQQEEVAARNASRTKDDQVGMALHNGYLKAMLDITGYLREHQDDFKSN